MTKTISQLWNGDLAPIQDLESHNPELKALDQAIQHTFEELEETLQDPHLSRFRTYNDSVGEYIAATCEQAFCEGFSLGLKLLSEAFFDQNTPA